MPVPVRSHRRTAYQVRHQRIADEMLHDANPGGDHVRTVTATLLCASARLMRMRMLDSMREAHPGLSPHKVEGATTIGFDQPAHSRIPRVAVSATNTITAYGRTTYAHGEPRHEVIDTDTLTIDLDTLITLNGGARRLLKRHAVPPDIMRDWGNRNPDEPVYPLYATPYDLMPYEDAPTELAQLMALGLPLHALCLIMPEERFVRVFDILNIDVKQALVEREPLL